MILYLDNIVWELDCSLSQLSESEIDDIPVRLEVEVDVALSDHDSLDQDIREAISESGRDRGCCYRMTLEYYDLSYLGFDLDVESYWRKEDVLGEWRDECNIYDELDADYAKYAAECGE